MKKENYGDYCTLDSGEVCIALGISRDTLYAYVSRGLVRAIAHPNDARKSLYDRRDIETLSKRKGRGRSRRAVAQSTINWGEPILTSKITRISDGRLYYRGKDVIELSDRLSLEEVMELIAKVRTKPDHYYQASITPPASPLPFSRILTMMAERAVMNVAINSPTNSAGGRDARRGDNRAAAGVLLRSTALGATGLPDIPDLPIHDLLSLAWTGDTQISDILRRALVLCADHELNASTYAARVAASAEASLPASLLAGLATLSGARHGGSTNRCLAWMKEIEQAGTSERTALYTPEGKPPPGFGHPLYPDGDPRTQSILGACEVPTIWIEIINGVFNETGVHPTLDFGLAFLERYLQLPKGAGLGIFAVGRTVGWIAHVFEQRESGRLIRPRAAVGTPAQL